MKQYKRIVVKVGTSVLTSGGQTLDREHMATLTQQCAALHQEGHDVVICSSGSIAVGRSRLGYPDLPRTIQSKQILAAVGQSRLMLTWEQLFESYEIPVGQILLTRADVEDRSRFLNARDTLSGLLKQGIIPIVNENDAVATEEIRLGDNDNLSALVSTLVDSDLLIILTDQAGLFTADPRMDPDAQHIEIVDIINDDLMNIAGETNTGLGVGGMRTKLEAARTASHAGTDVVIAHGHGENVILRVTRGESLGTYFPAQITTLESRKKWILAGQKPAGRLEIDDGAAHALSHRGSSLLPAGITAIYGDFKRSDVVCIVNSDGREIARGVVAYDSYDLQLIRGVQSDQISEILENPRRNEAVHRNNMILFNRKGLE